MSLPRETELGLQEDDEYQGLQRRIFCVRRGDGLFDTVEERLSSRDNKHQNKECFRTHFTDTECWRARASQGIAQIILFFYLNILSSR